MPVATEPTEQLSAAEKAKRKRQAKLAQCIPFIESEEAKPLLGEPKKKTTQNELGENVTRMVSLLTRAPEDLFDADKHLPLKKGDFEAGKGYCFTEQKAWEAEQRALKLRKRADEERRDEESGLGAKKKKLVALRGQMSKVLGEIKGVDGIDLGEILGDLGLSEDDLAAFDEG